MMELVVYVTVGFMLGEAVGLMGSGSHPCIGTSRCLPALNHRIQGFARARSAPSGSGVTALNVYYLDNAKIDLNLDELTSAINFGWQPSLPFQSPVGRRGRSNIDMPSSYRPRNTAVSVSSAVAPPGGQFSLRSRLKRAASMPLTWIVRPARASVSPVRPESTEMQRSAVGQQRPTSLEFYNALDSSGQEGTRGSGSADDGSSSDILAYLGNATSALPPLTRTTLTKATDLYLRVQEESQLLQGGVVELDGVARRTNNDEEYARLRGMILDMLRSEYEVDGEVLRVAGKQRGVSGGKIEVCRVGDVAFSVVDDSGVAASLPESVSEENAGSATIMCQLLTIGAIHRLPARIMELMLKAVLVGEEAPTQNVVQKMGGGSYTGLRLEASGACVLGSDGAKQLLNAFELEGWKSVKLPVGLFVKIGGQCSPHTRRRNRFTSKFVSRRARVRRNAQAAHLALQEACGRNPPRLRISRDAILRRMDEFFVRSQLSRSLQNRLHDATEGRRRNVREIVKDIDFQFFPFEVRPWAKRWTRFWERQTAKLKAAGMAGVLSYGVMNFLWYTIAVIVSWRRIAAPSAADLLTSVAGTAALDASPTGTALVANNAEALLKSFKRFAKVLASVYLGSQATKVIRLCLAVSLAPVGDRLLKLVQRRFGISERRSFWLLTGLLVGACLSSWATLILGDAFISSLGTFDM